MAFMISRCECVRGRPSLTGCGICGSINDHSALDRSVWYGFRFIAELYAVHLAMASLSNSFLAVGQPCLAAKCGDV
jgi:hypothetical protein